MGCTGSCGSCSAQAWRRRAEEVESKHRETLHLLHLLREPFHPWRHHAGTWTCALRNSERMVVGVVEVIRTCASHRCNCRTSAHLRSPPLGLRVGAQGAEHSVIGRSQQAWLHAAAVEPVTPRLRDASGPCQATRHSRCLHSSLHSYLHSTPTRPCFRHCQRKAPLDSTRSDHTRCLHVRRAQRQSRRCGVGFVPRRCLVQCSVLRAVSRLL